MLLRSKLKTSRTGGPRHVGLHARASRARALSWAAVCGALWMGCAEGSPVGATCETGRDCESGACNRGRCVDADVGGSSAGGGSAGGGAPVGVGGSGGDSSGAGGGLCSPNEDGVVERSEVPIAAGLQATFRVATDVTFSTAPTSVGGVPTWDLTAMLSGDAGVLLETKPLAGQWFEADFPGATYASRLGQTSDLLGVFQVTGSELQLLGIVSPTDGATATNLSYTPPVTILRFPLQDGASWSTTSTVTGTLSGVLSTYFETYSSSVDARGDVVTPFSTFDALRVRTDLTQTVGALVTTRRTFAFVTECFGTVATIASQANELSTSEFSSVSEIKRLSP